MFKNIKSRKSQQLTTRTKDNLSGLMVAKDHRRCPGVTVAQQQTLNTTTTPRRSRTRRCPVGTNLKPEVQSASRPFNARKSQHKKIIAQPNSTPNNSAFSTSSPRGEPKSSKSKSQIVNSCERLRIRTGMSSWRCRRSWELLCAAQSSASIRVEVLETLAII